MREVNTKGVGDAKAPGSGITALLAAARRGAPDALQQLFALVYDDLRRLARCHAGRGGHGATSLVHEAYQRFARQRDLPYQDRRHFFAVASRAMRQIAIDDARGRRASKRGSGVIAVAIEASIHEGVLAAGVVPEDLLTVDAALNDLEREDPRLARVVEWHVFGGLTFGEIGDALGVSERTVLRHWRAARALLQVRLSRKTTPT